MLSVKPAKEPPTTCPVCGVALVPGAYTETLGIDGTLYVFCNVCTERTLIETGDRPDPKAAPKAPVSLRVVTAGEATLESYAGPYDDTSYFIHSKSGDYDVAWFHSLWELGDFLSKALKWVHQEISAKVGE